MVTAGKLWKYITDSNYRFLVNNARGMYKSMADDVCLKKLFYANTGRELDLLSPKTYNEKLQWLKLHDRREIYSIMSDKYRAKEFVANKIGNEYVIPLLGVWDDVEKIDFDKLPNQFVLKCTHDSHGFVICKDKEKLDVKTAKKKLKRCLARNYYYAYREWPYKNIKPQIIAEKYMEDEFSELRDYKVMCFDGEPKLIELHQGRFLGTHYQDFYDIEWNKTEINNVREQSSPDIMPKPVCLENMLHLSSVLSNGIPHVRVDWYIVEGKLYFGEFTFYDAAGFDLFQDDKDDLLLGSWITVV